MADAIDHFPSEIQGLTAYQGMFDAYELPAENCQVLFATYPAGTSIEPHSHDTNNVGVITKGQLILTVGNETTTYGVGEWYKVAAHVEHAAEFTQDSAEIEFWFSS